MSLKKLLATLFIFSKGTTSGSSTMDGKDIPEPPDTGYFVGFSSLNLTVSKVSGKESCGIYFETLINVFTDGFWRPPFEDKKM